MGIHRAACAAVGTIVGGAIVAATALLLTSGPAATQPGARSPARAEASTPASCTERLLKDWTDGRIDGMYPLGCYRNAIKKLPVDLLVYSSAADDIRQALSERIVQSRSAAG
jgi:hypothetical protein